MIKTILVAANGTPQTRVALDTGFRLARLFDAHFECLHLRRDPLQMIAQAASADLGSGVLMADMLEALRQTDDRHAAASRAAFDELCKRESIAIRESPQLAAAASACWREEAGDETERLIRRTRAHDLVVIEHASGAGLAAGTAGALVIGGGRPVLIAPPESRTDLAKTIVIAWKDAAEAARAVTAAMPILAKAQRIVVASVAEDPSKETETRGSVDAVANHLRWHGLPVEGRLIDAAGENPIDALLGSLNQLKPDLLVMGGYGHGRFREFVFGGFTRRVLNGISASAFLFH